MRAGNNLSLYQQALSLEIKTTYNFNLIAFHIHFRVAMQHRGRLNGHLKILHLSRANGCPWDKMN